MSKRGFTKGEMNHSRNNPLSEMAKVTQELNSDLNQDDDPSEATFVSICVLFCRWKVSVWQVSVISYPDLLIKDA